MDTRFNDAFQYLTQKSDVIEKAKKEIKENNYEIIKLLPGQKMLSDTGVVWNVRDPKEVEKVNEDKEKYYFKVGKTVWSINKTEFEPKEEANTAQKEGIVLKSTKVQTKEPVDNKNSKEDNDKEEDWAYKKHMHKSLGKKRKDMPQIHPGNIDDFLIHFSDKTKVKKVDKPINTLKPVQEDINEEKILKKIKDRHDWKNRKYLISKDNYLLDAHHDWALGNEENPEQEVTCYKVMLPIKDLLGRVKRMNINNKNQKLEKAEKKDKDKNGGIVYNVDESERAEKVDLLSLPKDIKGTNCGNCVFFSSDFCNHKKILLPVNERMCCSLWFNKGSIRGYENPVKEKIESDEETRIALQSKYGINIATNFDKSQLQILSECLGKFKPEFIKGKIFAIVLTDMGAVHGKYGTKRKILKLNPTLFENKKVYGSGKYQVNQVVMTIVHEIGHAIDGEEKYSGSKEWREISGWKEWKRNKKMPSGYSRYIEKRPGRDINREGQKSEWLYNKDADFVRNYATKSPSEDWADSMSFFVLKQFDKFKGEGGKKKFNFIMKVLKDGKEETK